MADHVREQITVAAVAALTSLATTGANVFRDRDTSEKPLQPDTEVPGLTIEDDGDPAERITIDQSQVLERRMRLRVMVHVKATSGYSSTLNQILKEIEIAIAGASLGGAKDAALVEVGQREVSQAADKPTVRQAFNFELIYFTAANAPDIAL
jgi:hypothetical protein